MQKRLISLMLAALLTLFALASCGDGGKTDTNDTDGTQNESETDTFADTSVGEPDLYASVSDLKITFNGNSISVNEDDLGVQIDGNTVTLRASGKYTFSGTLDDGSIIVEAAKTDKVELVFDGVNITNSKSAPLYIKSCDKVTIILADGSENILTDAAKYELPYGEDKPNACLYSSEDIDFEGAGTLIVNGNYNNGIGSKNDIDIECGIIEVRAVNNAIKGNDSVSILGGTVRIIGADDGIKSDTETDPSKGFVRIEGGEVEITADDDAIQAYTSVSITGGKVITNAGGNAVNCDGSVTLAEGILTEN